MRTFMTKQQFTPSLKIEDPERTRVRTAPRPRGHAPERGQFIEPSLQEPADLYFPRRAKGLGYQHFQTLAEALVHVRDTLTALQRGGCVIQVGERRFESADVARLVLKAPAATE